MKLHKFSLYFIFSISFSMVNAQKAPPNLLQNLLATKPAEFSSILSNTKENRLQVIYTAIQRNNGGKVKFIDHSYNLDANNYFYPASTVKLPIAILALQKLNELNIKGLNKYTTMLTGSDGDAQTSVNNDPSAVDGRPTIAHYIKKILLVSDNDAFNRLYEFLGQEYINKTLHKMGYTKVQIIHRLNILLTEKQNRHTNPVSFIDENCNTLYQQAAKYSNLVYQQRDIKLGKGFYRSGQLVNEPFDFSSKNQLPLADLHQLLKSILFPGNVPKKQRFNLSPDDYAFLRKYMSMYPTESKTPTYTEPDYWDTYVKFIYYGAEKIKSDSSLRIFNKPGDAYGFVIDAAYVADYKTGVEFLVSAIIHCNSDGIYNDDKYEYNSVGFPFMKNLGRLIYQYELTNDSVNKKQIPPFVLNYAD